MIYNFQTCCDFKNRYFSINTSSTLVIGGVYSISLNSLNVCATLIDDIIPLGTTTYFDNGDGEYTLILNGCSSCVSDYFPCKPSVTPTPIPNLPINKNECSPITIIPMQVECVTVNPTTNTSYDGEISISITGGTPPYVIYWGNGNISPSIVNLSPGSYTAIVTDYYKDFTATTTCTLIAPKPTYGIVNIGNNAGDIINSITFNGVLLVLDNNDTFPVNEGVVDATLLSGTYTVIVDIIWGGLPTCIRVGGIQQTITGDGIYTFSNITLNDLSTLYIRTGVDCN